MSEILLTLVLFAALFVGFGLMNRGREHKRRCGSCHGCDDPQDCDVLLRESKE